MQITCCFISHYPKRAVAGSTIEITQKNSKAVQTPLFTCARRPQDPSPMWLFVIIGWFLDPSGVGVWFDCLDWVVGSQKTRWWEVSPSKLMNELQEKFS